MDLPGWLRQRKKPPMIPFLGDHRGRCVVSVLLWSGKPSRWVTKEPTPRFTCPAYGSVTERHPRQCILVGTTNEDLFLRGLTTGNRRHFSSLWWALSSSLSVSRAKHINF